MSRLLSFWDHVEELRRMILKVAFIILVSWLIVLFFYEKLIHFVLKPLQEKALDVRVIEKRTLFSKKSQTYKLPASATPVTPNLTIKNGILQLPANQTVEIEVPRKTFTLFTPLEGFLTTIKLTFWTALILSSPVTLLLILEFIVPALKKGQKKYALCFICLSFLFIAMGSTFAYKITLPFVAQFFRNFNETMGENLWGLSETVSFSLCLIFSHAIVFELYVLLLFLIHFEFLHYRQLKKLRRHMIVASLIVGAILTPPDVLSQLLLAMPMYLLYESAIIYARFKRKQIYLT